MSDTVQLILWIAGALIVVALIIWIFAAASRRRQRELQRADAAELRAQAKERLPEVQAAEDRASVTGQIAQEARAEAQARAAEAARLESRAEEYRTEAEAAGREHEALAREADRVDPDVATDEQGYRLDETEAVERGAFGRPGGAPGSVAAGAPLPGSRAGGGAAAAGAAGAAVAGAAFGGVHAMSDDDDEPDLADAENPFAGQGGAEGDGTPEPVSDEAPRAASQVPVEGEPERPSMETATDGAASDEPVGASSDSIAAASSSSVADDADWVNSPVDEDVDEELAASAVEDSRAEDWINGPSQEEEVTEMTDSTGPDLGSSDPDWVNAPVDENVDEELAASAVEDSQAEDWINGPGDEAEAGRGDEVDAGRTDETDAGRGDEVDADADWVNGPVDEDVDDELEATAAEDARAADWINGPEDTDVTVRAPMPVEPAATDPMDVTEVSVPALEGADEVVVDGGTPSDDPGDHRGQPWSTEFGSRPAGQPDNPGPIEHSDAAPLLDEASGTDEGDEDTVAEPVAGPAEEPAIEPSGEPSGESSGESSGGSSGGSSGERRISSFEEVQDGGYGIGSAAPLEDRAQPLGHAVKAWRESRTFRAPGSAGYDDDEPDVWFFNEEAARRAGFAPAGE